MSCCRSSCRRERALEQDILAAVDEVQLLGLRVALPDAIGTPLL
jgi:hypothetical protein